MRNFFLLSGILAASVLVWGQQPAANADGAVLTVGTEKLTKAQFEGIIEQITGQMPPDRRAAAKAPEARRQFAEQIAELMALAQEARRQKIDQTDEAKIQLLMRTDQVVASLLYQKIQKDIKPEAADLKAYYDAHKSEYESEIGRAHV